VLEGVRSGRLSGKSHFRPGPRMARRGRASLAPDALTTATGASRFSAM
jgi:hypothetical protein